MIPGVRYRALRLLHSPPSFVPASFLTAGALQSVPVVSPAKEHLASAIKRTARTSHASGIKSDAERERSKAARQVRREQDPDGWLWVSIAQYWECKMCCTCSSSFHQ